MERSNHAPNDPYYMHKQLLPFSFEVASAIWPYALLLPHTAYL